MYSLWDIEKQPPVSEYTQNVYKIEVALGSRHNIARDYLWVKSILHKFATLRESHFILPQKWKGKVSFYRFKCCAVCIYAVSAIHLLGCVYRQSNVMYYGREHNNNDNNKGSFLTVTPNVEHYRFIYIDTHSILHVQTIQTYGAETQHRQQQQYYTY